MEHFYTPDGNFEYIRYNSLPALADHIIDHSPAYYEGWGVQCEHKKPVGLGKVEPYQIIFVNADLLEAALPMLQGIDVPFHLLTGNADKLLSPATINGVMNTKFVTWTGHNFPKIDERFLQIPMGFTELGPKRPNSFTDYIDLPEAKIIPIAVTPFGSTHGSRHELDNFYGTGILNLKDRMDYTEFLTILSISKYSICPRGNALDSHRFVESIVCNSIPIVKTSDLDPVYKEMGGIIVNDWEEAKDYNKLPQHKLNRDVVTVGYWKNRLYEHMKQFEI